MKTLFTTLSILFISMAVNAQDTIKLSDFEIINNVSWEGTLTYKDYSSGEQSSVTTTLQTKIENGKLIYNEQYTYEPSKNNKSKVKIKKNGTYFGNEKVISNTFKNGVRTIVTSYEGKDNGTKATMYITREFSKTHLKNIKEVQLENSEERFVRNTYEFTKLK